MFYSMDDRCYHATTPRPLTLPAARAGSPLRSPGLCHRPNLLKQRKHILSVSGRSLLSRADQRSTHCLWKAQLATLPTDLTRTNAPSSCGWNQGPQHQQQQQKIHTDTSLRTPQKESPGTTKTDKQVVTSPEGGDRDQNISNWYFWRGQISQRGVCMQAQHRVSASAGVGLHRCQTHGSCFIYNGMKYTW